MVSPPPNQSQVAFPSGSVLPWGTRVGDVVYDFQDTIIYGATNVEGDPIWLWEAVPRGAKREKDGSWIADELTSHELRVLAWEELEHWKSAGGMASVPILHARVFGNTVWAESEPLPEWRPLSIWWRDVGPWPVPGGLLAALRRILIGLDGWHSRCLIHGGVEPNRLWLSPDQHVFLAPGGHRKVWEADRFGNDAETGPPELSDPRAAFTKSFDLHAVASVFRDHPDSLSGNISALFEECLTKSPHTRPKDAAECLQHLRTVVPAEPSRSWQDLDAVRATIQSLRYARRECPVCSGPMEEPRPLKKDRCPVCQRGVIRDVRPRRGICPECHVGALQSLSPGRKTLPCPSCANGRMRKTRKTWTCVLCEFSGDPLTENGRSTQYCLLCDAIFSETTPGLWHAHLSHRYLSEEEMLWGSLRGGPGQPPKRCDACDAGFLVANGHTTLVSVPPLTEGFFVEGYRGRALSTEELGWVAVGQTSLAGGFICPRGDVEFDDKAGGWKLIRTSHLPLAEHVGEINSPEDWHRLARGLPIVADEEAFEVRFERSLRMAYRIGEIGIDGNDNQLLWNSPAVLEDGKKNRKGHLRISADSLAFRAMFRRQGAGLTALRSASAHDNTIQFEWHETEDMWIFTLPTYHWVIQTKSGRTALTLTAEDLAARLSENSRG
ncbi:MAG: hypothetical protein KF812_06370 [Fimbriimonadaceae bacterium]|nr:hypothetical protein [Fimbriimonadaceae bacterium]